MTPEPFKEILMKLGDKEIVKDGGDTFSVYNYAELRLIVDGTELSLFFHCYRSRVFSFKYWRASD